MLLIVLREGLILIRKYLVEKVATDVGAKEYYFLSSHLLSLDIDESKDLRSGIVSQQFGTGVVSLISLVKICFMDLMPVLATAAFAFATAAMQNFTIALVMLLVGGASFVLTYVQIRSQRGIRIYLQDAKNVLVANVTDLLRGIEYVRASGVVPRENRRTEVLSDEFRIKELVHHKWMMSFDSGKQLFEGIGFVVIIGFSAWLASLGTVSPGSVVTFAMLYASFTSPLQILHRVVDEGWEACRTVNYLTELYGLSADPGLQGNQKALPECIPVIDCVGLTVRRPLPKKLLSDLVSTSVEADDGLRGHIVGDEEFIALQEINFQVGKNEIVGVAGPSGSGKSTLIKVLLGLVSKYEGSARVYGVEVRDVDKTSLATLNSYVPQSPFIINGTVKENICFGIIDKTPISDELINLAIEKAKLTDKIRAIGGLDAPVTEEGGRFSGGERQRLAISRLFLSQAKLVLLDEPTAALDTASQEAVQEAIMNLLDGRSAIIVAHRLSTLQKTDRIVVLDKGRIAETGTYAELSRKKGGLFRDLIEKERLELAVTRASS
jgi:ABC-type multidrug transport system fused ATPase/permease subunit